MRRDPTIAFEPVTPAHYPLLRRWLHKPHWRQWWGDPATEFGHIVDMVEGRDGSHPFVFTSGKEPKGYIQYWHIGLHQTEEWSRDNPWLMALDADTVGVDLSIGEESDLGCGLGSTTLAAFAARLRLQGHDKIIIDPDPANHRAIRAYVKAGFAPVPSLIGKGFDVLIMQHIKNPDHKSS